jgi:hypothetical protein
VVLITLGGAWASPVLTPVPDLPRIVSVRQSGNCRVLNLDDRLGMASLRQEGKEFLMRSLSDVG